MRIKSLKTKFAWLYSILVILFIALTTLVSYVLYCSAAEIDCVISVPFPEKELFIIFLCSLTLIGLFMIVLFVSVINIFVAKPLNDINDILDKITINDSGSKEIIFDETYVKKLKELNVTSSSEFARLADSIKKFENDVSEYLEDLKEQEWEAEHDSMTMLSNKLKFDRRKEEVYPHVNSLYIACLDIINLNEVNTRLSVQAGDSIISKVARELRRISSDTIHTYRIENDYFVMVFCGYPEDDAIEIIERWNKRLGRLNRVTDTFECSIVWGGSFGEKNFVVDDIFKRADAEMYCKKMIAKKELAEI